MLSLLLRRGHALCSASARLGWRSGEVAMMAMPCLHIRLCSSTAEPEQGSATETHHNFANAKQQRMWSRDEDELLRAGVKEHGYKWELICRTLLPARGKASCFRRWNLCLNPAIKSGPWSAEVSLLIAAN